MLCEMSWFLNSMKGSRNGLFIGPIGPDQAAALGEMGQLMQVGGGIVGSLLSFGAIAGHLMPALASAGGIILG